MILFRALVTPIRRAIIHPHWLFPCANLASHEFLAGAGALSAGIVFRDSRETSGQILAADKPGSDHNHRAAHASGTRFSLELGLSWLSPGLLAPAA